MSIKNKLRSLMKSLGKTNDKYTSASFWEEERTKTVDASAKFKKELGIDSYQESLSAQINALQSHAEDEIGAQNNTQESKSSFKSSGSFYQEQNDNNYQDDYAAQIDALQSHIAKNKPEQKTKPKPRVTDNKSSNIQLNLDLVNEQNDSASVIRKDDFDKVNKVEVAKGKQLSSPKFKLGRKLRTPKLQLGSSQKSTTNLLPLQMTIGLDFGTAYTKVVIGETRYAYAVNLGNKEDILPCEVFVDSDDKCRLNLNSNSTRFSDLKLKLLNGEADNEHLALIACFLGLVLAKTREWFSVNLHDIYKQYDIDWLVNAGIPAADLTNLELNKQYKILLQVAWYLSFENSINLNEAKELIEQRQKENSSPSIEESVSLPDSYIHPDKVNLFPEFIAQLAGYVRSSSRRQYAHCLIDVGAGTLDVACFIVKENQGIMSYPIYGKKVKNLGTEFLAKNRLDNANKQLSINTAKEFPSDSNFAQLLDIPINDMLKQDSQFYNAVYKTVSSALQEMYRHGTGGKFVEPITTFFCGGGSNVKLYKDVLREQKNRNTFYPLDVFDLKRPERLVSKHISDKQYHRFSVAYGLSFDPFELGDGDTLPTPHKGHQRLSPYHNPSEYTLYS